MVLTKAEISENLFEKLQLTKQDSKKFVEFFFEEVRKSLEKGEDVKLSGFGNFQIKNKKARPGRNPRTGESFLITARRVVTFKAGQKLKAKIDHFLIKKNNHI
ncbi:integration host factor subunit alpha [Buchnera aphidicola str. Ak (Acyrthosiphon kondoi)]|uniref:Integration host factor subunit alpha n=1 Tax=Buchnera aphidicola str. Ak (Acyrthosiphon kondoi) TaxID=1005090 RepID=G2LMK4_9GAMM|nr:integration host factor subunit alpha [Buchnera aphidicola]AEO08492.1 integration host factor subunit alpha [Buchnera aphidicola str. Ak (Acyrthosiphon kondoi)]WAI18153.1 MAG: integration host factor subunit alpha [Buchnera aphidicola (Acyrthosiphon caraganae)]